jgi:hypothetical protein
MAQRHVSTYQVTEAKLCVTISGEEPHIQRLQVRSVVGGLVSCLRIHRGLLTDSLYAPYIRAAWHGEGYQVTKCKPHINSEGGIVDDTLLE